MFCSWSVKRVPVVEAVRSALLAALCVTMAFPDAAALTAGSTRAPTTAETGALTREQKALHALNRFTFGPRPGDVEKVMRVGVDAWFDRQLHPERIDDSAFEQRLPEFPAMKLQQGELFERFPLPQRLVGMAARGVDPTRDIADPVERAIYRDAMARYEFARKVGAGAGIDPARVGEEAMQAAKAQSNTAAQEGSLTEPQTAGMTGEPISAVPQTGALTQPKRKDARAAIAEELRQELASSTLTREQVDAIIAAPPQQRFDRIVALSPADAFRFSLVARPRSAEVTAGLTPGQKEALMAMGNPQRVVALETLESRLLRDVVSERQLQAVMADFWLNHFSIYVRKNQFEPYLLNSYLRDAILPNALGNFEQLLIATAKSPAMMVYLDNWLSIGPNSRMTAQLARVRQMRPNAPLLKQAPGGINENYARELMELHTVGVNGGYTQKDVIEVAKCFTGWTVQRPYAQAAPRRPGPLAVMLQGDAHVLTPDGRSVAADSPEVPTAGFMFDPQRHEPGSKTVLGVTIPEGGMQEGLTVLHLLATSSKTAHFVSQKLAVRFVADTPPPALVDRMAATFVATHGDIKAVLSTMFHSPEFWIPEVVRAKVKTPEEFVVSAVRVAGAGVRDPAVLVAALDRLGMPLYGMQTPNGYSWQSADWVSTGGLVNRMNFALVFSGGRLPGVVLDWTKLAGGSDADPVRTPGPQTEEALERAILGQPAAEHTRETVLAQFSNPAVPQEAEKNFSLEAAGPGDPDESVQAIGGKLPRLHGQQAGFTAGAAQAATPLASMAGLLLGSPDFQKR